jgi:alanyl-tRNA synthetase
MTTRKLYYEDCHLRTFCAQVVSCEIGEKGWEVVLNATAFYPEGGGQACDLGTLGESKVLDVQERGETVVHLCDAPLAVGETVECTIDWQRRFDLMQQHSGEHIVSGLVNKLLGHHNVGFHVGKNAMEIDFDGPITAEQLADIERQANEAVWQNLPIRCWVPSREELPQVFYRTKRELPWPVRVVEVPGYDSCACCGVHVSHTGEIGLVKILSCVKFHKGVRLELLCGGRAYRYMAEVFEQNRQVSQAFSAQLLETGSAAKRMNEALTAEKFRCAGLEKRVFAQIAKGYENCGPAIHFEEGLNPNGVRELCCAIGAVCGGIAVVYSGEENAYSLCATGDPVQIKSLGAMLAANCGGRGGGKPGFWQGSVKTDRQALETVLRSLG